MMNNLNINNISSNFTYDLSLLKKSEYLFIFIVSILSIIILFIGLIGNVLVIYVVLNYGRLKTVTNTYLLHLALSDLVFLSGIPFFISSIITRSWVFGSFACKIFILSQGVNQYTSIIILALLSFDRYLAVCHSTKSISWRSRINPSILLLFIWMFSFLLMLPIILFTKLQQNSNTVQCTIKLPIPQSRMAYFLYALQTSIIAFIIPLCLMIYFHIKIVHYLQYKIPKHHRRSNASMRTRRKVTILVLTVISVHLMCCSPYWTVQMFTTSGLLSQNSTILISTSTIAQFLLFVNSSTNPILYAFISETFRTGFKRVFSSCLITTNDNNNHNRQFEHGIPLISSNIIRKKSSQTNATSSTILHNNNSSSHIQEGNTCNNQFLSIKTVQTNIDLLNKHRRLSSLAPPASIYLSETSCVSDV